MNLKELTSFPLDIDRKSMEKVDPKKIKQSKCKKKKQNKSEQIAFDILFINNIFFFAVR